jgi:hypothetical protein
MRGYQLLSVGVLWVVGCSTADDLRPGSATASGGAGAGLGGSSTASGGAGQTGGTPGTGGSDTGGAGPSSGGQPEATGGVASGSGGAGGSPEGVGGSGGSGGSPQGEFGIFSVLHGERWEMPCGAHSDDECENYPQGTSECPNGGYTMLDKTLNLGGPAGTSFDVTLRVRGVMEPKEYEGGANAGGHLYRGGTIVPSNYNVYGLQISSPADAVYFNSDEGQGEGHYVFVVDQTITVRIDANASLRLYAFDANCTAIANCSESGCDSPNVVPGVPPAPNAYDGQFAQVDVVSVVPAN